MTASTRSFAGRPAEVSVEAFLAPGAYPPDAQLVDGEIVMNDATFQHQELALRVIVALNDWCRAVPGRGRCGFGGNWVVGTRSVLKPDAWWVRPEDQGAVAGSRADVPATLAVEVRSPGTWRVDRGRKRELYEAHGVGELWLVDGVTREVTAHRRSAPGAAFDVRLRLVTGDVLTTPLLAGFSLDVGALFAGEP